MNYFNSEYKYPCGCIFPVRKVDNKITAIDFIPNITKVNLNCKSTWDLIGEGNTAFTFQINNRNGRDCCERIKPTNLEHLSDICAIIRPGSADAIWDDSFSATEHYIRRSRGEEPVEYLHPILEPILKKTYGILVYQEQSIRIFSEIGGLSLAESDYYIRKGIGKKKIDIITEGRSKFIEGVKKTGKIPLADAETIFDWIEKSARYSFNASHSLSYSMNAYLACYEKAHFPIAFFTSRLEYAKQIKEIEPIVLNAREMNIELKLPDLRLRNNKFIIKDKKIYWSLSHIKNVGSKAVEIIRNSPIPKTWLEVLTQIFIKIDSRSVQALIKSGALDWLGLSRNKMYFEYGIIRKLKPSQLEWLVEHYHYFNTLIETLEKAYELGSGKGTPSCNVKSKALLLEYIYKLNNPPFSLVDSVANIYTYEVVYLGAGISCSDIDNCDTSAATHSLEDIKKSRPNKAIVAGTVILCKEIKTKRGDNPGQLMAFIELSDGFSCLDNCVIFPDQWNDYNHLLCEGNTVTLKGKCDKNSFIIEKVWQAI